MQVVIFQRVTAGFLREDFGLRRALHGVNFATGKHGSRITSNQDLQRKRTCGRRCVALRPIGGKGWPIARIGRIYTVGRRSA